MSDLKISQLTADTSPIDTDLVPVVDITATQTKKATWTTIKAFLKIYFDAIYQAILVSGTSIKTINSNSLLGSGDIAITSTIPIALTAVANFETITRYVNANTGNGVSVCNTAGADLSTGAIAGSTILDWILGNTNSATMELGSPTVSATINLGNLVAAGTDYAFFIGLGAVPIVAAGATFTSNHFGFKVVRTASGANNLFATQGNGTTETASASLTTMTQFSSVVDLIFKINGSASADYYWRKDGSSMSAATNLATNLGSGLVLARLGITNKNVASTTDMVVSSMSYTR